MSDRIYEVLLELPGEHLAVYFESAPEAEQLPMILARILGYELHVTDIIPEANPIQDPTTLEDFTGNMQLGKYPVKTLTHDLIVHDATGQKVGTYLTGYKARITTLCSVLAEEA